MTEDSKAVSKDILELQQKHSEEFFRYESMLINTDFQMLQHIIDYSKMGTKGLFVLNGTAAVSILTIFTNALTKDLSLSNKVLDSAIIFAMGALFSIICIILSYFAQKFYQTDTAEQGNVRLLHLLMRQKDDEGFFYNENCRAKTGVTLDKYNEITKELQKDMIAYQKQKMQEISEHKEKAEQNRKTANIIRNICVGVSILSIGFFIWGVVNIKNSFSTPEEPTNQISSTVSSYPNVQIAPILNKH